MKSFDIEKPEAFLKELCSNERYDSFYLYEVRMRTALDYYINGQQNMDYFDSDDKPETEYVLWKDIKKTAGLLLGEDKLPQSLKLILMFNEDNIEKLISMNQLTIKKEEVGALFYNVYIENGQMSVTTGASIKVFTMDKSLEHLWDETVMKYYIG